MIIRNKPKKESFHYSVEDEPIVLSKPLMDTLLSSKAPGDCIALYSFYYYTAKWQKTNQPKASDNYCMQGLKWGYEKFRRTQDILTSLGLIKRIRATNRMGRVTGWYIHVRFLWKRNNIDVLNQNTENQNTETPDLGNKYINALSSNNINALSSNNKILDFFLSLVPPKWNQDQLFQSAIKDFIKYRSQKGKKLTQVACERLAKKLSLYEVQIAIDAINRSIDSSWTGVFPESEKGYRQQNELPNSDEDLPTKFK